MSAVLDQWRKLSPASKSGASQSTKPVLWAVPDPENRIGKIGYAVIMIAILALGLVGVLVLNTQIQSQASQLSRLQRESRELGYQEAALITKSQRLNSVNSLASEAKALGMVPNPHPAFINIETGKIVGDTSPIAENPMPELTDGIPAPVREEPTEIGMSVESFEEAETPIVETPAVENPAASESTEEDPQAGEEPVTGEPVPEPVAEPANSTDASGQGTATDPADPPTSTEPAGGQ